jgi:release factor glutamine methyltransferase
MPPSSNDRPTLRFALNAAEKVLAEGPHPDRARRDAEALLLFVLRRNSRDTNLAWLIAHDGEPLAADAAAIFCDLIERRLAGEPMQYITGETEFYRMPFYVNRSVLIPRPETELLVEKALQLAPLVRRPRMLDLGTGSGAIAITLAHECPDAVLTATDLSSAALDVAHRNAERLGFADRIRFLQGDLLESVAGEQFDIVVSNPPYVPDSDRATLDVEVRNYEPPQALFAGEDGLEIYRRLIPAAFGALVPGGFLALEIGYGQQEAVHALLAGAGFTGIDFTEDLQKIPRVVIARRP